MEDIRAICAIGQRVINGRLPWERNKGREYVADVARFFEVTRGHVLIAGPRTIASFPASPTRTAPSGNPLGEASRRVARLVSRPRNIRGRRPSGVEGLRPFIRHWDITRLPYDGEADRGFDPVRLVVAEKG